MLKKIMSTFQGDRVIWVVLFFLSIFSILAVSSSTSMLAYQKHTSIGSHVFKHVFLMLVAYFIMWFLHNISYQYYSRFYKILLGASFLSLIYASLFGHTINDASRWIMIPLINQTFQASDLAKLALMLYLARHLSVNQADIGDFKKGFLPMLLVTAIIVGLIFMENVSTSLMVGGTALVVMFLGKVRIIHFLSVLTLGIGLAFAGSLLVLKMPEKYLIWRLATVKSRLESFSSSKASFKDVNYQVKQANIAIARGGLIRFAPGNSVQKHFLPNAFSDYIYAIIIEEYGLLGGLFIVLLYLVLLWRIIKIVINSPHTFGALLALGLGISIVLQAFTHIIVNVGIAPTTGVTLPLISMGGSSIFFIAAAMGIILSVSRAVEQGNIGKAPEQETHFDDLELQLSNYKNDPTI